MKSILSAFCIFLFVICCNAQTSVYHPFPTSEAVWREYKGIYQYSCSDYQHFILGDTTIAGQTYNKIIRSGVSYWTNQQGFCTDLYQAFYSEYAGAYRNDSINKKVYIVPTDSLTEQLLYDFDLHLWDTLTHTFLHETGTFDLYVTIVDSVLIGNSYHKRFGYYPNQYFDLYYAYLIEGIGSEFGLLGNRLGGEYGFLSRPFECGTTLICVKQDNRTIYPDTNYQCNLVITQIQDPIEKNRFKITPVPVQHYATFDFPDEFNESDVYINNIYGKEMDRIHNIYSGDQLNFESFPDGLYFITLLKNNHPLFRTKIIVSK
ncbi:MAG: T9SS type A sorting domain-containing protein [Bacteroidales bacterium]|jgi:hypothetical protein|nr:T9SS type A sorting domain-containing protein [Bacteroidales bacterium]